MIAAPAEPIAAEDLRERAGELRFLARLLAAPPDAALLADAEAVGLLDPGWESRLEEIQVEFTRLFSAPGPDAIPVHQSVYTGVLQIEPAAAGTLVCGASFAGGEYPGYLGGEFCAELRRWYAAASFQPPSTEMPDHIAVQLDFLAHLLLAGAGHEQFRARFLDRWLPDFAQKLATNPVSDFYRRVGDRLRDLT